MIGIKVVLAADGAIEFYTEGSSGYFYDISTELQKAGLDWWLKYLSKKNWYDQDVKDSFIDVWYNAKGEQ